MAWGNFTVLPGAQDPFGSDVVGGHYRRNECDLMITLADVFMMDPGAMKGLNVIHWLPIDCEPMGRMDREKAQGSAGQIAMSRFGQEQMRKAGFDPFYVPHGIDTTVFCPPQDRKKLREDLGFDPDDFLIGMNVANKEGPRKGIQEQVIAFAAFHERHPKSKLMVHSFAQPGSGGLNIKALADHLGVTDAIMLPDQYAYATGLMDTPTMAKWYGMLDLYTNASYGEGFGLGIIEAQACGTPVVVTKASTMPELCGVGWQVSGEPFWVPGHDAMWMRPNIAGIIGAYESAFLLHEAGGEGIVTAEGDQAMTIGDARAKAREFAVQYDADTILEECWKPVLDVIESQRPRTRQAKAEDRKGLSVSSEETGKKDLALLVPSRGRPENVQRLIQAVCETSTAVTDIVVGLDDDDPKLDEYKDMLAEARSGYKDHPSPPSIYFHVNDRMGLAEWTNYLAETYADRYRYLGSFGDDHCPQTPGWDSELLKVLDANGPGFAYPNDLVRSDIPQAVVISSEIVKALGWMCQPDLKHYYVDNVWSNLGQFAQCIWYLPDVIVEHVHHLRHPDKVSHDQTYRDNEAKFTKDNASYERWRMEQLQADVETIKAVREKATA